LTSPPSANGRRLPCARPIPAPAHPPRPTSAMPRPTSAMPRGLAAALAAAFGCAWGSEKATPASLGEATPASLAEAKVLHDNAGCAEGYRCCTMETKDKYGAKVLTACVKEDEHIRIAEKSLLKSTFYTCGKFWKRDNNTELGHWSGQNQGCHLAAEYHGEKSQGITKFVRHKGSHRKRKVHPRCCMCQRQGRNKPTLFFDERGDCQDCAEMPIRTFAVACKAGPLFKSCDDQCRMALEEASKKTSRTLVPAANGAEAGVGVFVDSRSWVWIRHGRPCAEGGTAAQGCGLDDFGPENPTIETYVLDQWGHPEKNRRTGQLKTCTMTVPRHSVSDAGWQLAGWDPSGQDSEETHLLAPIQLPEAAPPLNSTRPIRLWNIPPVCSRSMASLATMWGASQTSVVKPSGSFRPSPTSCMPEEGDNSFLSWWSAQWCSDFWKCECVGPCSDKEVKCCMKAHARALDSFVENDQEAWQEWKGAVRMSGNQVKHLKNGKLWEKLVARVMSQVMRLRRAIGEEAGVPPSVAIVRDSAGTTSKHAWIVIQEACGGATKTSDVDLGCGLWDFSQENAMAMGNMEGEGNARGATEIHWVWGPTLVHEPADHSSVGHYFPAKGEVHPYPYPAYCARAAASEVSIAYNESRGKNEETPDLVARGWKYILGWKDFKNNCRGITEAQYRKVLNPEPFHDKKPMCWDFVSDWKVVMCHRYSKCMCDTKDLTERGECRKPELVECCRGKYEEFLIEHVQYAGPFLRSSRQQRQLFPNATALVLPPAPEKKNKTKHPALAPKTSPTAVVPDKPALSPETSLTVPDVGKEDDQLAGPGDIGSAQDLEALDDDEWHQVRRPTRRWSDDQILAPEPEASDDEVPDERDGQTAKNTEDTDDEDIDDEDTDSKDVDDEDSDDETDEDSDDDEYSEDEDSEDDGDIDVCHFGAFVNFGRPRG